MKIRFNFVVHKSVYEKIANRKEARRLKQLNTYIPEYTGEGPVHAWLDAKKIKHLLKFYQDQRNQHRFTFQLDVKEKQELNTFMKQYTEQYYLRMIQERHWLKKHNEQIANVRKQMEQLPYLLKNELDRPLNDKEQEYYQRPELDFQNIYMEQKLRLMSEEDAMNNQLAMRIFKIQDDKLGAHE